MAANRFRDFVMTVWPNVLGVQRVFQANMDPPHAIAKPLVHSSHIAPYRFRGVKPFRTDSVITRQSQLRGLPFFDALRLDQVRRESLNMRAQSAPPPAARTIR